MGKDLKIKLGSLQKVTRKYYLFYAALARENTFNHDITKKISLVKIVGYYLRITFP